MKAAAFLTCTICQSEYVKEIEKVYRKYPKILPIAEGYAERFGVKASTMRVRLKLHFENLHRKYRIPEEIKRQEALASLEDKGVDFNTYKDKALKNALVQLESGAVRIKPTDIAALENVSINKAKVGLEKESLKLRMASVYGGFIPPAETVEGEVVKDESTRVLPENTR